MIFLFVVRMETRHCSWLVSERFHARFSDYDIQSMIVDKSLFRDSYDEDVSAIERAQQ
jgi:hypothetical protein